jgi:uncharacterized protein (TIGR02996 family)
VSDDLGDALRDQSWPRALELALELWREHRDPRLADLIDTIGARCAVPPAPKGGALRAWWMRHAEPYEPVHVTPLVATADELLVTRKRGRAAIETEPQAIRASPAKSGASAALARNYRRAMRGANEHVLAPLVAMLQWPADPRAATILVRWLVTTPVRWDPVEYGRATDIFYSAIADHLYTLADARALPALEACAEAPRAETQALRQLQRVLARQVIEATTKRARKPRASLDKRIARWQEIVGAPQRPATAAPPPRARDESALWAEIARRKQDLGPRQVLADVLVERGDPRGEMIVLQCMRTPAGLAQAKKLVTKHWSTWLGDLALVLNRKGTEFRDGMLDEVRVGVAKSPEWAFSKVHGHRELGTVRIVRPGHVSPMCYVAFLRAPNLDPELVELDAPKIVDALCLSRRPWTIRKLAYTHQSVRNYYRTEFPPLASTFGMLATVAQQLEELQFDDRRHPEIAEQLGTLAPELTEMFPKLRRIEVVTDTPSAYARVRDHVAVVDRTR